MSQQQQQEDKKQETKFIGKWIERPPKTAGSIV